MRRVIVLLLLTAALGKAQAPSKDAIAISLTALNKTFVTCRSTYAQVWSGDKAPYVKDVLGETDYQKDLGVLDAAQTLTAALLRNPEKTSGKILLLILSTLDDFAHGVQSTIGQIYKELFLGQRSMKANGSTITLVMSGLNECQRRLFDDSDTFTGLVFNYVEDEDSLLGRGHSTKAPDPKR